MAGGGGVHIEGPFVAERFEEILLEIHLKEHAAHGNALVEHVTGIGIDVAGDSANFGHELGQIEASGDGEAGGGGYCLEQIIGGWLAIEKFDDASARGWCVEEALGGPIRTVACAGVDDALEAGQVERIA